MTRRFATHQKEEESHLKDLYERNATDFLRLTKQSKQKTELDNEDFEEVLKNVVSA